MILYLLISFDLIEVFFKKLINSTIFHPACCNFATCELKPGAECAQGGCCSESCKFKPKGSMCRDKLNQDCDVEEYCTGTSHLCPENK